MFWLKAVFWAGLSLAIYLYCAGHLIASVLTVALAIAVFMIDCLAGSKRGRDVLPQPNNDASNAAGKRYLDRLRQEELSVGAALRRGEAPGRAPGQASGAGALSQPVSARRMQTPRRCSSTAPSAPERESDENFTQSFVAAEITGSAAIGYAAGGSAAGALLGEAASISDSSSTD